MQALIDTGSTQTLVLKSLVPREDWNEQEVRICCVHGDVKPYPTADVFLTVEGQTFLLSVALAPQLPPPVVLEHDLPILYDLVSESKACNVVTWFQAAREGFQVYLLLKKGVK